MLKATHANPGRIDVAQGTIVEHCCQFYSDKDLRGRKIAVDLGLFVSNINELGKLSPAWQLIYPLSGSGSTFMTLVGTTQQWQNFEVILTALDSQTFVVQLKFVQLADLTTYLGSTPFDSYLYFTGAATQGGPNVYDSLKFLSVKATVQHPNGLEEATCDTEWAALRWCENPDYLLYTDYFTTDIKNVNGWVTGKDLTVRFSTKSQDPINAKWYGGIIRASSGSSGTWWDDIRLQYGTFAQFVSQVNTTFDFSYLTDSRSLLGDTYGNYEGLFVVDKDYFVAGESYQAFFIWEENGTLKSCISNVFGEEVDPDSPVLVFDSENTITLNDNADIGTLNETCLHNLSPCQDVTVCTTIDAVSFDAALAAAGLPYTLDQLISGTLTGIQAEFFAYGAEFLQVNSPPIFTNFTYPLSSYVPNVSWTLCAQFNVPTEWQGETRYVFLFVKLALPGGGFYEILFPFTFTVVEYGSVLEPTETPKQFYCEDTEEIEFCFQDFDDTFNFIAKVNGVEASDLEYVTEVDPDFTDGEACLTIDYTKVSFNQDICFCLVAQKNVVNQISPEECPCGNIEFAFESTFVNNQTIYTVDIDISDVLPDPTGSSWNVVSSLFIGQQEFLEVNTGQVIFVGPNNPNEFIQVTIVTADGCVYILGVGVPLDPTTIVREVCPSNTKIISIPCDKDPALDVFCTGGLFYEANLTADGGTIDSFEYTFDFNTWTPYTVPVDINDGAEIFIKALITYPEVECGTFELWGSLKATECGNCYEGIPPINSCPDYLNVSVNWNEQDELLTLDGELLLNIFGESASTCEAESDSNSGLEYSFDGITYFEYTVPIDTTGYNVVYYQWFTNCGGCADTVAGMWERDKCCGGGSAVVVGLCEAMTLLPDSGPLTPNYYVLGQDPETEECGKFSFEICPFLEGLTTGEPPLDTAVFIYIDGGVCKKGTLDLCTYLSSLTIPDPLPADLVGLYFIYTDETGCHRLDISGYLGGGDQAGIQFQNEGVNLGTAGTVDEYDHVGPGVTAARAGNKVTVTYSAWQALMQYYENGVALGTSGTVTDFNRIGTFGELSRISNALTLDFGPYERYETTNTSHVATKFIWFYYIDCTSGNLIFDLPAAAGNGSLIYVKKIDSSANTLEIRPDGTDEINGTNASYFLTGENEGVVIKSDLDGLTDWQFVATNLTNHTGEVTGQRNLVVNKTAISNQSTVTAAKGDTILIGDASDSNNLKKVLVQTIRPYERTGCDVGDGSTVLVAGFAGYKQLKFPTATATLIGVTILANDTGNLEFDIEKSSFAGFPTTASIVGVNAPELVGADKAEITIDGGWTTSFSSGDCLKFEIIGTPTVITYATLILYFELE